MPSACPADTPQAPADLTWHHAKALKKDGQPLSPFIRMATLLDTPSSSLPPPLSAHLARKQAEAKAAFSKRGDGPGVVTAAGYQSGRRVRQHTGRGGPGLAPALAVNLGGVVGILPMPSMGGSGLKDWDRPVGADPLDPFSTGAEPPRSLTGMVGGPLEQEAAEKLSDLREMLRTRKGEKGREGGGEGMVDGAGRQEGGTRVNKLGDLRNVISERPKDVWGRLGGKVGRKGKDVEEMTGREGEAGKQGSVWARLGEEEGEGGVGERQGMEQEARWEDEGRDTRGRERKKGGEGRERREDRQGPPLASSRLFQKTVAAIQIEAADSGVQGRKVEAEDIMESEGAGREGESAAGAAIEAV